MKLTYYRNGDYLLPDLAVNETDQQPLGKYGMLRLHFLETHRPVLYNELLLSGRLMPHLHEIDVADIGNGTMNLLYLRNGRPDESRCWTEKQGVGQCVGMVNKSMMDKYGIQMDEAIVEQVLRAGASDMQEEYLNCVLQAARWYVTSIFDTLRAHGYDPRIMRLWIVGGGGCLVRNFGTYDASRVTILDDLCATAKGYEYLAYGQMLRKGRA